MACNCKKRKVNIETNSTIPPTHTMEVNKDVKEIIIKNKKEDKQ